MKGGKVFKKECAVKFDTGYWGTYFKEVHDHQKQLCNICSSASHVQCPNLICRGNDEQGHKKKKCKASKCDKCAGLPNQCYCPTEDDGSCPYKPCECVCGNCDEKYDECKCHCEGCGKLKEECKGSNEEEMDDDKVNEHDVENHPKIEAQVEVHPMMLTKESLVQTKRW
ncbi:Hypothetical predicted protein [Mytilus galloprovincialis]|uniref:Uncharacterized protein n=1 Tax=Mytilus galloprovincialis TaxID=29158 RepID=A0A8B6GNK9_MYTGA|nr:Hypothetical predicted protein [Mytilus galloprovincialis]